jgi:hypothetical protein
MSVLLVRYSIQDAFSVRRSYPRTIVVAEIPVKPIRTLLFRRGDLIDPRIQPEMSK